MMAHLPPPTLVIRSDGFLIRRLTRGDASPALEAWIDDDNAAAMLNTRRRSWTVAEQATYFATQEMNPRKCILGIFPAQAQIPIGLFVINVKPKHGVFTISHLIGDKAWRGKDTTRRASEAVYDYLFNTLGYAKAKANVRAENKAMLWLMYNYAWKREARLIKHIRLTATGGRSDLLVFGMLASEWDAWREHNAGRPLLTARRKPRPPASQP
jgi:RimJ/RimL family protein N-acetyltransferase